MISNPGEKITETELLSVFPEAKQIIAALIKDREQQRAEVVKKIQDELADIKTNPDEVYQYFWRSWLKLTLGEDLIEVDKHIARLSRQLRIIKGVPNKVGQLTMDLIESARAVPIESLLDKQFRRSGRDLVGLCPFHTEKTPSFHIYTSDNRGWCFGCSNGGDVIKIAMLLHGYDFKEAVLSLTGGGYES